MNLYIASDGKGAFMLAILGIDKCVQMALQELGFFITYWHLLKIKKNCQMFFLFFYFVIVFGDCMLISLSKTDNNLLYSLLHGILYMCFSACFILISEGSLWKIFAAIGLSDLFGGVPQLVLASVVEGSEDKLQIPFAPGVPYIPFGVILGGMGYLILLLVLRKYLIRFSIEPMERKLWVRIFAAVYTANALFRITSLHSEIIFSYKHSWKMGTGLGVVTLIFTVVVVFSDYRRTERQKQYYLREQNQVLKWHYETLKEQIAITRRFQQDVSDMFRENEGSNGDISDKMPQRMLSAQMKNSDVAVTGGEILNQVLLNKRNQCAEEGIILQIEADGIEFSGFEEMDVVILLYNILDNAIESCSKIPDKEQRRIWVKIEQKENSLIICCRNDRWGERVLREGKQTWKKDKNLHGTGMEIIRAVTENYQGRWTYEEREKDFFTRVVLLEII